VEKVIIKHPYKAMTSPTTATTTNSEVRSTNEHTHRAAIHLNNVGCSLLQRQCFPQALSVFRDAIRLMRHCTSNEAMYDDEEVAGRFIQVALCNAAQKLSNTTPAQSSLSYNWTTPTGHLHPANAIRILTLSSQTSLETLRDSLVQPTNRKAFTAVYYPVNIDPIDANFLDDEGNVELQSATILYNFAIVHRCLTTTADCELVRERLAFATRHLFGLADRNLARLLPPAPSHPFQGANICGALLTSVTLMHILIRICLIHAAADSSSGGAGSNDPCDPHGTYLDEVITFVEFAHRSFPGSAEHNAHTKAPAA
jgi:hypothetical protein